MIADNRLALDAGWDEEMLALELADLSEAEYDLALTGFEDAGREQREKNGGKFAETDDFGRAVLKRKPPETAPTLGKRAKKIPTDKGWDFTLWWRNTEPNSRPQSESDSNALALRAWIQRFGRWC